MNQLIESSRHEACLWNEAADDVFRSFIWFDNNFDGRLQLIFFYSSMTKWSIELWVDLFVYSP